MSTAIYQGPRFLVATCANTCDRCGTRGLVVEFFLLAANAPLHVCFPCLNGITDSARLGVELPS